MTEFPDLELDVCHHSCPVPLIRLALAVKNLAPGQRVQVRGDDPIFEQTIVDFCLVQNLQIVEKQRDGRVTSFILKL